MKSVMMLFLVFSLFSSYTAKADRWDGQLIDVSANSGDTFDQRLLDAKNCAIARINKYVSLYQGQFTSDQVTTLDGMVANLQTVTLRKANPEMNGPKTWYNLCRKMDDAYMLTPDNYSGFIVTCPSLVERGLSNIVLCELLIHEAYHTTDNHENPPQGGYSHQYILDREARATMWQYLITENSNPNGEDCHYASVYSDELRKYLKQKYNVNTPAICSDSGNYSYKSVVSNR